MVGAKVPDSIGFTYLVLLVSLIEGFPRDGVDLFFDVKLLCGFMNNLLLIIWQLEAKHLILMLKFF
jgi:hypothetical protein